MGNLTEQLIIKKKEKQIQFLENKLSQISVLIEMKESYYQNYQSYEELIIKIKEKLSEK